MKLKLVGNMLVVTSNIKKEDFLKVTKIEKDSNVVVNEEGNTVFVMKFDDTQTAPRFQDFACTFNQEDEQGNMQAVIPLTPSEDYDEVIVDEFGSALNAAKQAEDVIAKNIDAVLGSMNELLESIEE